MKGWAARSIRPAPFLALWCLAACATTPPPERPARPPLQSIVLPPPDPPAPRSRSRTAAAPSPATPSAETAPVPPDLSQREKEDLFQRFNDHLARPPS